MTKRTSTKALTPDAVKAYRDHASSVPIIDQIGVLNQHSVNQNMLRHAGLHDLAKAAEWAWLAGGPVPAQTPVAALDQATTKVDYLEMCLADRVLPGSQRQAQRRRSPGLTG